MTTANLASTLFILDFDATITESDTISAFFSHVTQHHRNLSPAAGQDAEEKVKWIVSEYSRDLKDLEKTRGKGGEWETVGEMVEWQRAGNEVERKSFGRVSESGLLGRDKIEDGALQTLGRRAVENGDVVLRRGFRRFLQEVQKTNCRWGIISVNFSESWIRGILGDLLSPDVKIFTNEPNEDGILRGPEYPTGGRRKEKLLLSSEDKLSALRIMVENWREGRMGTVENERVIYFGDSGTDLECLVEVGGIVMVGKDGESKLLKGLKRARYERLKGVIEFDRMKKGIYYTKDFGDVLETSLLSR